MKTLTIYHGTERPFIARGHNQCRLLDFAFKYKGWHTIGKNYSDIRAMHKLAQHGMLEVSNDQFRIME